MAETKTATRKAKPRKRSPSKPKAKAGSPNSKPKAKRRPSSKPKGLIDKTKAAGEAMEETAKDAGRTVKGAGRSVGRVAGKAKVPLVAGGAALAGAATGIAAVSARQSHRHRLPGVKALGGVRSKDIAKAARKAGDVGAQVGEIALEVRRARERSNGNGRHRSPIEVVLQGLTSRGSRD
jgi:hypothetical protein